MDKYNSIISQLQKSSTTFHRDAPLAKYTTLGVGGPADLLVVAGTTQQLLTVITIVRPAGCPFKVIGKGSNLVFSDNGYRGIIIVNQAQEWQILPAPASPRNLRQTDNRYGTTAGIPQEDTTIVPEGVLVQVASGNRITPLIKELFKAGITGLEWFTGIPATVGGAVYMNIHGADHFFGDCIETVKLISGDSVKEVGSDYFKFAYDWSILHETQEIVLEVVLRLKRGDVARAKRLSHDWARYKANQPQRSAGCIFQNLTLEEKEKVGIPTPSVGYLIDKVLGLKGSRKGNAVVSSKHAAFIENLGGASAEDVLYLINLIQQRARQQLGLELKSEVEII
jgi:UDP-N-acetylmuramate dehydrogenase